MKFKVGDFIVSNPKRAKPYYYGIVVKINCYNEPDCLIVKPLELLNPLSHHSIANEYFTYEAYIKHIDNKKIINRLKKLMVFK